MIEPVRRMKVADAVAEQLERLITEGQYALGEKLPAERVLAEQFGVGRSSMREALTIVEANGLIRTDHGIGVFVVRNKQQAPSLSQVLLVDDFSVADLFEVRVPLEEQAAGLVAKRITPAAAEKLKGLIAAAADPSLTDDEFIELDGALHQAIAEATNNPLLVQLCKSVAPLFFTYSHRVIALPGRRERAHLGHERIVTAIVNRRIREARTAAVKHIREVENDILESLD